MCNCTSENLEIPGSLVSLAPRNDGLFQPDRVRDTGAHDGVIVSFTAATSWLSVNGFGRKANC
jgi:hypothetical protein